MTDLKFYTPKTHPDHHAIGKCFKGWDGKVYYCDSYEVNYGFWMTRVDCPDNRKTDQDSEFRRNVSERAVNRSFHVIYNEGEYGYSCQFGRVRREELGIYANLPYYQTKENL